MLGPLLGSLAFVIVLILILARRFDRIYAIEERYRAGLPYEDLLRPNTDRLIKVIVGLYFLGAIVSFVGWYDGPPFREAWDYVRQPATLSTAAITAAYITTLYVIGRVILGFVRRD